MNQKQKMTRNVIKFLIIFFIALLSFNIITYIFTPDLKESMTEGDIQRLSDRISKVNDRINREVVNEKSQNDFSLVKGSDVKRDDIVMVMDPNVFGKMAYHEFTRIDLRKGEKAPYTYEQFLSVCYMLGMTKLQLGNYIKNNDSKLSNNQKMLNLIEFSQKRNYRKITDPYEFNILQNPTDNILGKIISGKEKRTMKEIADAKKAEYMARKNK